MSLHRQINIQLDRLFFIVTKTNINIKHSVCHNHKKHVQTAVAIRSKVAQAVFNIPFLCQLKMEMFQRHLHIYMMAQSKVSDGLVRESTQFNTGVTAQTRNPFQVRTFNVQPQHIQSQMILVSTSIREYEHQKILFWLTHLVDNINNPCVLFSESFSNNAL